MNEYIPIYKGDGLIEGFNGIGDPGSFGYEPWG